MTGTAMSSLPKNMTTAFQQAINKCESLSSGKQLILHGNPSGIFPRIWQSFDVISDRLFTFSAVCHFKAPLVEMSTSLRPAANLLLGYSSGNPFETKCREGLSCSPIQLFQHHIWSASMDDGGVVNHTLKQKIKPIIHLRKNSLMILMFLSDQVDHHLLVVKKKWDLEKTHVRDLPLRPSQPEPQLILIPMSDGDDDQSPHDEKQRMRSRSLERVHPPAKSVTGTTNSTDGYSRSRGGIRWGLYRWESLITISWTTAISCL